MAQKGVCGSGERWHRSLIRLRQDKLFHHLQEQNIMRFDIVKTEPYSVTEILHIRVVLKHPQEVFVQLVNTTSFLYRCLNSQACRSWYSCSTMKVSGKQEVDLKLSFCPANVQGLKEKKKPMQQFSWNNPGPCGWVEGIWINGLAECLRVEAPSRNTTLQQKCLSQGDLSKLVNWGETWQVSNKFCM